MPALQGLSLRFCWRMIENCYIEMLHHVSQRQGEAFAYESSGLADKFGHKCFTPTFRHESKNM